jgi:predicted  nucleic acid-binding Zn-ribbon protein
LEELKAKIAELEEKNKELVEELVKAREEHPAVNGDAAKAITEELEVELEELRAKVAAIQETVRTLSYL